MQKQQPYGHTSRASTTTTNPRSSSGSEAAQQRSSRSSKGRHIETQVDNTGLAKGGTLLSRSSTSLLGVPMVIQSSAAGTAIGKSRPGSAASQGSRASISGRSASLAVIAAETASAASSNVRGFGVSQRQRPHGKGAEQRGKVKQRLGKEGLEGLHSSREWQITASTDEGRRGTLTSSGDVCSTAEGLGRVVSKAASAAALNQATADDRPLCIGNAGPGRVGASLDEDWETVLHRYRTAM